MGEQAFRELASELNKLNVTLLNDIHSLIWAAGNHSSLRHHKPTTDQQVARIAQELACYFAEHEGAKVCITEREGSLFSRQGNRYEICRGTDFGRTYLLRNAERLFDLGATGFHSDLDIGPLPDGVEGCFNLAHGHPIPCGTWSYAVARQKFADIRALAPRKGVKPFLLTKEHCTESLIPVLDGYLSRPYFCLEMPAVCLLSQYLFHEYIPPLVSGAGSFQGWAAQVIYGQPPGVTLNPHRDTVSIPLLRDYCRAMKGRGRDFLLYGKMKRPVIAGIPTNRITVKERQYVGASNQDQAGSTMEIPSVLHSVWEEGEGNIGVFAVNLQEVAIELRLPAQGHGAGDAVFEEGGTSVRRQRTTPGEVLAWKVPPKRLCSVVFERLK